MALRKQIETNQHGFTAERFLIDHEDADEFTDFRDGFFAEHQPETPTETFLVEQMIAAAWRIRRIRYTESAFWNQKMSDLEEDLHDNYKIIEDRDHLAYAVARRSNTSIENLSRYEARLERAFYKALHELERLRVGQPPRSAAGPVQTRPAPVAKIGFVSPKPQIVHSRPVQPPPTDIIQEYPTPQEDLHAQPDHRGRPLHPGSVCGNETR